MFVLADTQRRKVIKPAKKNKTKQNMKITFDLDLQWNGPAVLLSACHQAFILLHGEVSILQHTKNKIPI